MIVSCFLSGVKADYFGTAPVAGDANGYVLAMVGHLNYVSPTFAQISNRITNVKFTTVSPTVANTMCVSRMDILSFGHHSKFRERI